jgi:signal peptidase I
MTALLVRVCAELGMVLIIAIDGAVCAKAAGSEYVMKRYNRWYVYVALLIAVGTFAAILSTITRSHVAQALSSPTPSMEPAILLGDHFLVDKRAYRSSTPRRGDVALFQMPASSGMTTTSVKRVVGLPGEAIEIREKRVLINGMVLEEAYVQYLSDQTPVGLDMKAITIPAGSYFLLGDNRDNSNDSRYFGPVSRDLILGKVRLIFYSSDPEAGRVRWDRIGVRVDAP